MFGIILTELISTYFEFLKLKTMIIATGKKTLKILIFLSINSHAVNRQKSMAYWDEKISSK